MLLVYARKMGNGSNNLVEAMSLFWGLQLISEMKLKEITIEGESKLIIDLVKGASQPRWNIQNIIMDIKKILEGMESVHLQHIYREGNKVAHVAAATGFKRMEITCWRNMIDLNDDIKSLITKERGRNII